MDYEWIEQARFVKFEEDVENGGNRPELCISLSLVQHIL